MKITTQFGDIEVTYSTQIVGKTIGSYDYLKIESNSLRICKLKTPCRACGILSWKDGNLVWDEWNQLEFYKVKVDKLGLFTNKGDVNPKYLEQLKTEIFDLVKCKIYDIVKESFVKFFDERNNLTAKVASKTKDIALAEHRMNILGTEKCDKTIW